MKRNEYGVQDSSKVFLWALLLPQILAFVSLLFLSVFFKTAEEMQDSIAYLIMCTLVAQVAFALVFFIYNKKNKIDFLVASKLKCKINWLFVVVCIIFSVIAIFGLNNFVSIFDYLIQKWGLSSNSGALLLPNNNLGWLSLNIVLLAIIPPIFEELIFRGMIFNGLRKRGFWFACLISSSMFAIMHLSISQLIFPFIMGILLAIIVEKTGSIVYSMITHVCNNLIVVIVNYLSVRNVISVGTGMDMTAKNILVSIVLALVAVAFICAIIYFVFDRKKKCVKVNETVVENALSGVVLDDVSVIDNTVEIQNVKKDNVYLIVSVLMGVAFWVLMFVLSLN